MLSPNLQKRLNSLTNNSSETDTPVKTETPIQSP